MPETLGPPGRPISRLRALGEALGITVINDHEHNMQPRPRRALIDSMSIALLRTQWGQTSISNADRPQNLGGTDGDHHHVQVAEAIVRRVIFELTGHIKELPPEAVFGATLGLPNNHYAQLQTASELLPDYRAVADLPTTE